MERLTQEEKKLLHLVDAVSDGFHKILLRTVDTDIVVAKLNIQEFWIAFGQTETSDTSPFKWDT